MVWFLPLRLRCAVFSCPAALMAALCICSGGGFGGFGRPRKGPRRPVRRSVHLLPLCAPGPFTATLDSFGAGEQTGMVSPVCRY